MPDPKPKPDLTTVAMTSPKGQERAQRIRNRITILLGYRGCQPKAERVALEWILARLEAVERELKSFMDGEIVDDDGCDLCRDLPTSIPAGHRYLRSGIRGFNGVHFVHSSKCSCGASENEIVVLRQHCEKCSRRRARERLDRAGASRISQAQAVAILDAWSKRGDMTDLDGRPVLDGLDLEELGIW